MARNRHGSHCFDTKYSTMKLNSVHDVNLGSNKPVGSGLFYQHYLLFIENYV